MVQRAMEDGIGAVTGGVEKPALAELRHEIRRRWGVVEASLAEPSQGTLSTGCTVVDELLGGGIPAGRLTEVSGRASSGKTSLVVALAAQVLRHGDRVGWVDPEKTFYAPSAARAGVPLERLMLVQPASRLDRDRPRGGGRAGRIERAEQAGRAAREGSREVFRAGECLLKSGAFALVVLDASSLPGHGITAPLFRLNRLALRYGTAVVLMTDQPDRVSSLGSCIALRLRIERRSYCFDPEPRPPFDIAGYRIEVQVGKSKLRRTNGDGAVGLVDVWGAGGVTGGG